MTKGEEQVAVTIATWVVMLSALTGLVACGKKAEKTPEPVAVAEPEAVEKPKKGRKKKTE